MSFNVAQHIPRSWQIMFSANQSLSSVEIPLTCPCYAADRISTAREN